MKLHGLQKLSLIEVKLYMREPEAVFFTLFFPLMLLFLFGSIWGNTPFEGLHYGYVDYAVPAFTGMVIATSGIMSLTTNIASYREKGILRRLRVSPISPVTILLSEVFAIFVISTAGMVLLVIAGKLVFGLRFFGNVFEYFFAFLFCSLSISAMGFIPACLARSARSGMVIANFLYFPMLFLSGAVLPYDMLPSALKTFSLLLPLTHVVKLLQGLWYGGHLTDYLVEIGILTGVILAGVLVATKTFKWE